MAQGRARYVQDLNAGGLVEPFGIGVLSRPTWLDVIERDALGLRPCAVQDRHSDAVAVCRNTS